MPCSIVKPTIGLLLTSAFLFPTVAPAQKAIAPPPPKVAAILAETQTILKEVSQLRELPIKRPVKAGYRSRTDLERDVIGDFDESVTPADAAAQSKMLIAFGLVPKGYDFRTEMVKLLTEQIGGFYRPKTGEFVLTESPTVSDPDEQRTIVAHELTHALQDQNFDLRRFEKPTKGQSDRDLAIHSLIEGDATVVMIVYNLKGSLNIVEMPVSLGELMMAMSSASEDAEKTPVLAAAPKAIKQSLLFPYAGGAGFVQSLVKKGGWKQVSQAFTDLPESTEQILHPEKYFAGEHPIRVTIAAPGRLLGDDWKEISSDVNGEFGYRVILGEFLKEEETRRAAAGWGGDACRLFENTKTGELFLVQHTVWDDGFEAADFLNAYTSRTVARYPDEKINAPTRLLRTIGNVRIERRGAEVLILEGIPGTGEAGKLADFFFAKDAKSTAATQNEKR
jgi:hypothetical protein